MTRTWLGDPDVVHGEGAFWDSAIGGLRHVDMLRGDVMTLVDDATTRAHVSDVVAVIRARQQGGYVVAVERGFALLDEELRVEQEVPVFTTGGRRMNEGGCDPSGRLHVGTMAYDCARGAGTLYRLDPDLSVHVVLEGLTVPNGLVWDAAGTTAFHADSDDHAVYAYAVDPGTGAFGERRVHLDLGDDTPDGMALDVEGGLWVACWAGGEVRRYDAAGTLSARIDTGVSQPTSCAFGGEDGDTLFITTSRQGLTYPEEHAGQVLAVRVGVRGVPVHAFRG